MISAVVILGCNKSPSNRSLLKLCD